MSRLPSTISAGLAGNLRTLWVNHSCNIAVLRHVSKAATIASANPSTDSENGAMTGVVPASR